MSPTLLMVVGSCLINFHQVNLLLADHWVTGILLAHFYKIKMFAYVTVYTLNRLRDKNKPTTLYNLIITVSMYVITF